MISFFESQNHSIFAVQTDHTISKDEIKKLEWLLGNASLLSDVQIKKEELEKIVLCDLQTRIYPELEDKFLTILRKSGLPDLKFGSKIDFEKLYKKRLS